MPLLEWVLGALALLFGVLLIRARQQRQAAESLSEAREETKRWLFEENKQYKALFELGDASYKESQERIQTLRSATAAKDIVLTKGTAALEAASANMQKLLVIVRDKNKDIQGLEQSLRFQEEQYGKLFGQKKSSEVRTGKITEQISPFLADYPLPSKTARFIGDPIDFVHFDEDKVTFVEVKTGKSQLSKKQRRIRDMIKEGKVDFIIYRVSGDDDDRTN